MNRLFTKRQESGLIVKLSGLDIDNDYLEVEAQANPVQLTRIKIKFFVLFVD